MRAWGATVVCLALVGCVGSDTRKCGELTCPGFSVCSPKGDRCVLPEQIVACNGLSNQDPCTYASTMQTAFCFDGVCTAVACGNGIIEPGEVCDDGNTRDGDGCSPDCKSNESCGHAI